jgi:predicted methyltransferase
VLFGETGDILESHGFLGSLAVWNDRLRILKQKEKQTSFLDELNDRESGFDLDFHEPERVSQFRKLFSHRIYTDLCTRGCEIGSLDPMTSWIFFSHPS